MPFRHIWGADSGDLVSSIYNLGTAHPPGYPHYYLLGQLFRQLPWGTPAQKIGLLSLTFSLLLVLTLILLLRYLAVQLLPKLKRRELTLLTISTLILLGGSYLFWLYSLVPEVFSTSLFFITLNVFFLVRYLFEGKKRDQLWFALTFLVGLTFQYIIVANMLVYLSLDYQKLRRLGHSYFREIYWIMLFLALSFVPYLILWFVWDKNSIIFWVNKSPLGLWQLISRAEYGLLSTSFGSYQSFLGKLGNLAFYVQTLTRNFAIFGLGLAALGMYQLFVLKRWLFNLFTALWFVYGPLLFFYFDVKIEENFSRAVLERFAFFSFPYLVIFGFFGFYWLYTRSRHLHSFTRSALLITILGIFPMLLVFKNVRFISKLSQNTLFASHASNLLETLPKNSLVLLSHDLYLFPAQYARYVLHQREDLIVVAQSRLQKEGYANVLRERFPALNLPLTTKPNQFSHFLRLKLKERRIFTNLKFRSKEFKLKRYGLLSEVVLASKKQELLSQPKLGTDFLKEANYSYPVYFQQALIDIYSDYYYEEGLARKEAGQTKRAADLLATAHHLDSSNHDQNVLYALLLYKTDRCPKAAAILKADFAGEKTEETALILARLMAVCFKDANAYRFWNEQTQLLKPQE